LSRFVSIESLDLNIIQKFVSTVKKILTFSKSLSRQLRNLDCDRDFSILSRRQCPDQKVSIEKFVKYRLSRPPGLLIMVYVIALTKSQIMPSTIFHVLLELVIVIIRFMLSVGLCDHIYKVPNNAWYNISCITRVGYCYQLVNVISLNLSHSSDHIKRLTLSQS
jgi:hypothetical protein